MSGTGRGPAIGMDLSTTKSCVGEIIPNDADAKKKKEEDEEAKQFLVDMIVAENLRNSNFMEQVRVSKEDASQKAWEEKRKKEKEELKKKREDLKKKREEKVMGKKKKK